MTSDIRKIVNVEYSSKAADLVTGFQNGPVCGYTLNSSFVNQSWYVEYVGPNQVQIKNTNTNVYAGFFAELEGVAVSGVARGYTWILNYNDNDQFQIVTSDGQYVWVLESNDNNFPIVLRNASTFDGPNSYWVFQTIDDTSA